MGQVYLSDSFLHVAFAPLLSSNFTLFNLLHDQHHHDCYLTTWTVCQSIHILPETVHCPCVAVIAGGIYMTMYGIV